MLVCEPKFPKRNTDSRYQIRNSMYVYVQRCETQFKSLRREKRVADRTKLMTGIRQWRLRTVIQTREALATITRKSHIKDIAGALNTATQKEHQPALQCYQRWDPGRTTCSSIQVTFSRRSRWKVRCQLCPYYQN
jgi:hypothetical protein